MYITKARNTITKLTDNQDIKLTFIMFSMIRELLDPAEKIRMEIRLEFLYQVRQPMVFQQLYGLDSRQQKLPYREL
jgi:hypothetical protein